MICRNRAGCVILPFLEPPLALAKGSDMARVLKSPLFSSAAYRHLCSHRSPQHHRLPPPAARRSQLRIPKPHRAGCPLLKPTKPSQREVRTKPCRAVLCLHCSSFASSFSHRRFEGKAEVRAPRCTSCTTDLYTHIPLFCCA